MITTILESGKTTHFARGYNENKVAAGNASIVCVRNIPNGDDSYSIQQTFSRYEDNLAVSARTKRISFHMAVSPGVDDDMSENDIIRYVDGIMESMGYGSQPYVIYRHNDIEREHYHVVSIRVKENGRHINSQFEHLHLMKLQEEYSKVFNFYPGLCPEAKERNAKVKAGSIDTGSRNLLQKIRTNIEDVIDNYSWSNALEVKLLLKDRGIEMRRKHKDDNISTSFVCRDADGRITSRPFSAGKLFPDEWFEDMLRAKKERCEKKRAADGSINARVACVARFCERKTECVAEFGYALSQMGFSAVFLDKSGRETANAENIAVVILTNIENRSLFVLHEVERRTAANLTKKPFKRKGMKKRPLEETDVERLRIEMADIERSISRKQNKSFI